MSRFILYSAFKDRHASSHFRAGNIITIKYHDRCVCECVLFDQDFSFSCFLCTFFPLFRVPYWYFTAGYVRVCLHSFYRVVAAFYTVLQYVLHIYNVRHLAVYAPLFSVDGTKDDDVRLGHTVFVFLCVGRMIVCHIVRNNHSRDNSFQGTKIEVILLQR